MNRLYTILIILNIAFSPAFSQIDSISIVQCFRAARTNAATKPQLEIMEAISELKIDNASSTNLPELSAFGKGWYQSDAIKVPGPTGITVNQFQYNFGLEADQKIYDGGMARKSKESDLATAESDKNKIETDLYKLNDRVLTYFFNSLLFDENSKTLALKLDYLQKRLKEMESGVKNGIIKNSDCDKIIAESLSTQQQMLELEKIKLQMIQALQILTDQKISETTFLFVPDSLNLLATTLRPEIKFFDSEAARIEKSVKLKSAQNLPKFYAFGQLGYSYPGLNFFANAPDYYYIVGAKLSWTILDWKQVNRETQVLRKQEDIIKTQRDDFDRNLQISIQNEQLEQDKLMQIMQMDDQIISKRAAISASSASALANGVITSSVYIEDLNNEIKARFDMETHKIQYQNSIVKSFLLKGTDISEQ